LHFIFGKSSVYWGIMSTFVDSMW